MTKTWNGFIALWIHLTTVMLHLKCNLNATLIQLEFDVATTFIKPLDIFAKRLTHRLLASFCWLLLNIDWHRWW